MKITVIGAGFAALSAAWYLSERGAEVTLYDPKGIGKGASGVSTGLLHPFPGKRARLSWRAEEGMEETRQLLKISEEALGAPIKGPPGIFRPALSEEQRKDFSTPRSFAEWKDTSEFGPGLWIESGLTVYSRLYLEGLWRACAKRGVQLRNEAVSPTALPSADATILANGFEALTFYPHLPLKATWGQTLLCKWEKPLPFSLVSQGHITPTENPHLCQVGSTYEHTPEPNPELARELLSKAALFYPPAARFEIVEIRSGVRLTRKEGYQPMVERIAPRTWIFTGLGSRGLLYHALLGKELAAQIC